MYTTHPYSDLIWFKINNKINHNLTLYIFPFTIFMFNSEVQHMEAPECSGVAFDLLPF